MARSLRSKRRQKNKRVLKERYKPKFDAQLQSIVANMQKETQEMLDAAGDIDMEGHVEIIEADKNKEDTMDIADQDSTTEKKKIKLPKVDATKVAKFLSQRKRRKLQRDLKKKNESMRKKMKPGGVIKKTQPAIKW